MAIREMQTRYAGTLAGLVWSIVHPLMMILTYWLVFSKGLKVAPSNDVPFVAFFLCGFVPWMAFAETVSASANAIVASPHLVKKIVFPTEILPVVHMFASMISHVIMIVILLIVLLISKIPLSIYNIQFLYFIFGLSFFCVGVGWLVSALNVFYRDVGQIVLVILNIWFWLTPIVWPPEKLGEFPNFIRLCLAANPMYYVVQGYRDSFIHHTWFWENLAGGVYFWALSLTVFAFGGLVFRKLKPDFADVL